MPSRCFPHPVPAIILSMATGLWTTELHAAPLFPESEVWSTLFATLDVDGDGQISQAEYDARGDAYTFVDLDRNQDRSIDIDELADWVRLTHPRPSRSELIGPGTKGPDRAAQAVPPPTVPPKPTASLPPATANRTAPAAAPAAAPVLAPERTWLRFAAIGGLTLGVLSMAIGVWVRSRRGKRRRQRR